jgi:hypothetical protein
LELTGDHDDERHLLCPGLIDHVPWRDPPPGPVAGDPGDLVGIQCRKNLIQSRFTVEGSKGRGA